MHASGYVFIFSINIGTFTPFFLFYISTVQNQNLKKVKRPFMKTCLLFCLERKTILSRKSFNSLRKLI